MGRHKLIPNQAVAYTRVSTAEQGKSGLGLQAQRDAIERFAAQEGLTIAASYSDIASGGSGLNVREGLKEAIYHGRRIRGCVIVAKLDRLSRSVEFVSTLMSRGVPFLVAELGSDVDPFILHLFAALSEKERRMISTRTKAALQALKDKGVKLGNMDSLPRAQAKGSETMATRAAEFAERFRIMIKPMHDDGMTLAKIADRLNETRIPTFTGKSWNPNTVRRMLLRYS